MKRGVQGLLTKNKGHIYIYLSILFDAFLEVESGQAEFFVFSLPQTCRELCLTLLYIENAYKFTYVYVCVVLLWHPDTMVLGKGKVAL